MERRYFAPFLGLKRIWDDDREWHNVTNQEWIVVIIYNSVLLSVVLVLGILVGWKII